MPGRKIKLQRVEKQFQQKITHQFDGRLLDRMAAKIEPGESASDLGGQYGKEVSQVRCKSVPIINFCPYVRVPPGSGLFCGRFLQRKNRYYQCHPRLIKGSVCGCGGGGLCLNKHGQCSGP